MAPFKWQQSDGSSGNGLTKIVFEVILVGCVGALIAWGAATTTLDSVKTTVADNTKWRGEHSMTQAKFEGAVGENISIMKELLKEIRDEQKEIRKELNKKQDKK
jgi:hypothetical protein